MVYKPKNNYSWGDGFKPKMNANIVGGVIEQIEQRDGCITKESFLNESRPIEAPTHDLFEWDDSKAAEKYRLHQATTTIGNLRIVHVTSENEEVMVKAFVNVSAVSDSAAYKNITLALQEDNDRENILNRIKGELDALIQRNKNIEELADMLIAAGTQLKKTA